MVLDMQGLTVLNRLNNDARDLDLFYHWGRKGQSCERYHGKPDEDLRRARA